MANLPDAAAMQAAIDKIEICELQNRYMWALDWHDPEVYSGVFAEDGELAWPEGSAKGKDAIRTACIRIGEHWAKLAAPSAPAKAPHLRHFITNQVVEVSGDRARAVAYWCDFHNDNTPRFPYLAAYGHYQDDLVRTADGWRFTRREIFNEMTGETPADNPCW